MYTLKRENQSLQNDIRNFKNIEDALKSEINEVLDKRREVEETREELKDRVCKDAIKIR